MGHHRNPVARRRGAHLDPGHQRPDQGVDTGIKHIKRTGRDTETRAHYQPVLLTSAARRAA